MDQPVCSGRGLLGQHTQIGDFSVDGTWDAQSIDVIRNSLKDLGILNFVPEAKTIYNDKFVPVRF